MLKTRQDLRLSSRSEFQEAMETILRAPCSRLRIFDRDLNDLGLESRPRAEVLSDFLHSKGSIQIVLHSAGHLLHECPRLLALYRTYGHRFLVRTTPPELRSLTDSFILADDGEALVRSHSDHFRGRLILADADAALPFARRFAQLWDSSVSDVVSTPLGL